MAVQPNCDAIGHHLQELANQIILLPNAAPAAPLTLAQVQHLIQQMQHDNQQQMQQQMQQMQQQTQQQMQQMQQQTQQQTQQQMQQTQQQMQQMQQQTQQQMQQIQQQMQQMQHDIQHDIEELRNELVTRLDLIPLQLYNSKLPNASPLQYPPGVDQNMPLTKTDLEHLTVQQCQQTAAALGLPALPNAALVADRRRQIQVFLGAIQS